MPNQQTVATGARGLSDRVDQVIEQISQTSSLLVYERFSIWQH